MVKKHSICLLSIFLFFILSINVVYAKSKICIIYFTKIGCPVCAQTDPIILDEWIKKYNRLVVIEYVINKYPNAVVMGEYNLEYGTGGGVPLLIFNETDFKAGIYYPQFGGLDRWKAEVERKIETLESNPCLLLNESKSFEEIKLNDLPGEPSIWARERLITKIKEGNVSSDFLNKVLFSENLEEVLKSSNYRIIEIKAEPTPISFGQIDFKKAFKIEDSWILKCNEDISGFSYQESGNNGKVFINSSLIYLSIGIISIVIIFLIFYFKIKVKIKWS